MTVYRDYLRTVPDRLLGDLWDEIAAWEINGSLPSEAGLRKTVSAAFTAHNSELLPNGTRAIDCDACAKEVWREIARRKTARLERVAAAVRMLGNDEITPTGQRVLDLAFEADQ